METIDNENITEEVVIDVVPEEDVKEYLEQQENTEEDNVNTEKQPLEPKEEENE